MLTFYSRHPSHFMKYPLSIKLHSLLLPIKCASSPPRVCTLSIGGALTVYPHKVSPQLFLTLGVHLHPLHPLATPMIVTEQSSQSASGTLALMQQPIMLQEMSITDIQTDRQTITQENNPWQIHVDSLPGENSKAPPWPASQIRSQLYTSRMPKQPL